MWSQTFSYDAFGNITKSGNSQFQPGYNYQTNEMASGASYDSNGDVLSDSLHSYAWDVETRPTTIDSVSVTYDALSRMVEQTKLGASTEIQYSPTGFKMQLMNGQTPANAFVPLPGGAVMVFPSNGPTYYRHPDWLGSSRFASTYSRTMYNDLAFAQFGEQYAAAGTTGVTNTSFAGNNQDTVSNMYDAYFREYGIQGRWPSPDPVGIASANPANPQSWNRYAYALNNPLLFIDPSGLFCVADDGEIIPCQPTSTVTVSASADNAIPVDFWPLIFGGGGLAFQGDSSGGGGFSQYLGIVKNVNQCAGQLSQSGSVTSLAKNLVGLHVPEVLGSNTFGDVASLATGSGGLDQGMAVAADATAHTVPSIASQVAIGTATTIGTAVSHTPGVYNPVTVGTTSVTVGMKTAGKFFLGATESVLTGKVLLDAGVYIGALYVCTEQ